jgi:uncharacterized protein
VIQAVLDTNVLVSALLRPFGKPAQIIEIQPTRFDLILSEAILAETEEVLGRKRIQKKDPIDSESIKFFLIRIRTASIIFTPQHIENVIKIDPPDNVVLACAVESKSQYLVSGNRHFLDLKEYRGVTMVTPSEFLDILSKL